MKQAVNVAITGAAGQIGYALAFRVASGQMLGPDQPVNLHLLEITPALAALNGVVMELNDCAFPTLNKIVATDDAKVAFKDANGAVRRLGDVSSVVEDHQPLIGDANVEGNPGLVLVVEKFPMGDKFPTGDTQEITREVDKALAALEPGLPGVIIDKNVFRSDSFLSAATNNLSRTMLIASLCAIVLLLLVFREWRALVVNIIAIGLSLTAAMAVLLRAPVR